MSSNLNVFSYLEVAAVLLVNHDDMHYKRDLTEKIIASNLTNLGVKGGQTCAQTLNHDMREASELFKSTGWRTGRYSLNCTGDKEQFVKNKLGVEKYNAILEGLAHPPPPKEIKDIDAWEVAVVILTKYSSGMYCNDITRLILETNLAFFEGTTQEDSVRSILSTKKDYFLSLGSGYYKLNKETEKLIDQKKYDRICARLDELKK